jgi:hypothetical protein
MAETPADVLVAGCPDIDGAKDFGSLGALVRDNAGLGRRRDRGDARPRGQCRGAAGVRQPRPRGAGRRGRSSRLASSRRCCWRRSPSGLSRAG